MKKKRLTIWILEAITFIVMLIFLLPIYLVLINASKSNIMIAADPVSLPDSFGVLIDNVVRIWNHPNIRFPSSLFSSVIITVLSVGLLVLISSMAAWVLCRRKSRVSTVLFLLFVGIMIVPFQVIMLPLVSWFNIVQTSTGIPMLKSYLGIIFAYMGFGVPLSVFLFHGFIKSVPLELEEAATIDGCAKGLVFFRIVLPILKPIIVTVIVLNGLWIWNDFLLPLIVLGLGNEIQTLPLAVSNFVGSFVKKWDLILTSTLMAMTPMLILFIFVQKYVLKGMVDGALK